MTSRGFEPPPIKTTALTLRLRPLGHNVNMCAMNHDSTPAGLEPTRDEPNRFLVDRLNRSATVSDAVILLPFIVATTIDNLQFSRQHQHNNHKPSVRWEPFF
uniref:Uncharacterized protein n=1 Tax=Pseudo-nitzschia australis TaxID=44445 RepID=A0A7S4AW46_9STRA